MSVKLFIIFLFNEHTVTHEHMKQLLQISFQTVFMLSQENIPWCDETFPVLWETFTAQPGYFCYNQTHGFMCHSVFKDNENE
jgi:hypothetical protein